MSMHPEFQVLVRQGRITRIGLLLKKSEVVTGAHDQEQLIISMLVDLMHWARANDIRFVSILALAADLYDKEIQREN
jgi:hypothetical protein